MNTKDLIVEKTLKLILEKGTIDISISEIRNCTGLTTGGIYYHFSDKNDIFEAIMQKYMIDYIKIDTGHGDYLCADVMEKKVEGDNE